MLQNLKAYQVNYLRVLTTNYKRYIHDVVNFDQKLIGIVGARGVGKTTFLLQYLKENNLPLRNFTTFFHPFHKSPSTFSTVKQASKIVA